jgi:hypothetical protein
MFKYNLELLATALGHVNSLMIFSLPASTILVNTDFNNESEAATFPSHLRLYT